MLRLWDRFWFGPIDAGRAGVYRVLVLLIAVYALLVFLPGVRQHASNPNDLALAQRVWRPVVLLELLNQGPPGATAVTCVGAVLALTAALALAGLFTSVACLITAVLATWWMAVSYSFGKPHHDCIALTFALWALPFGNYGAKWSVDAVLRRGVSPNTVSAFPIRLAQVSIALGYTFAGGTKLGQGGVGWINGYSLQGTLMEFDAPWTEYLVHRLWLCQGLSIYTILLQVTFLLALWPRLGWVYALMGFSFHMGTWMTMDTGPYLTLSYLVLAAFLPWDSLPKALRCGHPAKKVLASVGFILFAGWLAWIYASTIPIPKWK